MDKTLKGVYAVTVTPFTAAGHFDIEAAERHVNWLIENGIQGVCLLGATGEYQSVSNEEHKFYLGKLIPAVRDRASVIVGASRENPDDVIDLMNAAQRLDADAAMVLPPFYCHPNQQEILENYRYISSRTTLPMIVYNNPGSAGVDMTRETLQKVFELPNTAVLKESTGDIHRLTEAVMDAPSKVNVFCGCDNLALESFLMGAAGWISMAANFAPRDCNALFIMVQEGRLDSAKEVYQRLLPALNLLESSEKPAATIKYILKKYRNLDVGSMHRPRIDLSEEEQAVVDHMVDFSTIA